MDKRKKTILTAVIEDYVITAEPVGSKRLVAEHNLDISSATVRHELAELEEMGFLEQPHPSSGRVPSDMGYRFYVDSLDFNNALSFDEKKSISLHYKELDYEVETIMKETSILLTTLTSYASLVFAPVLLNDKIKHLDLVLLSPALVLMVVITNAGSVAKKMVDLKKSCDAEQLGVYEKILNQKLVGINVKKIATTKLGRIAKIEDEQAIKLFICKISELLNRNERENIYYNGALNLLSHPEFESLEMIQKLLSTLEKSYQLLGLLSDISEEYQVVVKIGAENVDLDIEGCSLVASSYQADGETLGALGILGPTRMAYPRVISAVQNIAEKLGNVFESINKRG